MSDLDRDAIKARAEAADTPGPWETRNEGPGEPWHVVHDSESVIGVGFGRYWAEFSEADAEHIAAFNPKAALALLAALEEAEMKGARMHDENRKAHDDLTWRAASMAWATDGRLSTALVHNAEWVRRIETERDEAIERAKVAFEQAVEWAESGGDWRDKCFEAERRLAAVETILVAAGQRTDTDTHWANGERRLLRPEAYERISAATRAATPKEGDRG